MGLSGLQGVGYGVDEFDRFVHDVQDRLQVALVATYGVVDGRIAAVDALSWAWEHWPRVIDMANPVGYLYRVGQSATRRLAARPVPIDHSHTAWAVASDPDIDLLRAVARLPDRQRAAVLLVHAFGWTLRDVGELFELAPSTVRAHLERGLAALKSQLEVSDAC